MKTKHAINLYVLGIILGLFGALLMYYSHPWTNAVRLIGDILQVVGGLLFLYKLLTYPRLRDFLNW